MSSKIIKKLSDRFEQLAPYQVIVLGFLFYVVLGVFFISLPFAQKMDNGIVNNLFNVVSAMSTTGLTTGIINDMYTKFGLIVLLVLIQLGAVGYMTLTSFFIISGSNRLSTYRAKILSAEFPLPDCFHIKDFIKNIVLYTFFIELIGILLLWWQFEKLGSPTPLWSAIFHAISAFSTAGFSIYSNGLEGFRDNIAVNLVITFLCYAGATGFIVPMDVYRRVTGKSSEITFTTKVILFLTAVVAVFGTIFYLIGEHSSVLSAFFQVMSASTTAGFNTVPIGRLAPAALSVLILAMVIGASPSGTGGGIKTTGVSALIGVVASVMRGHPEHITLLKRHIPLNRVFTAVAAAFTYLSFLGISVYFLCLTEHFSFMELCFEASSALGTVGLSMGITSGLTWIGKLIITATMFFGRVGPLTLGIAFFKSSSNVVPKKSDLAT